MKVIEVEGMVMRRAEVEKSSEAYNKFVGGQNEIASMGDGFVVVCNENGIALGLKQNIIGVHGRCFITKIDTDTLYLRGLTDEEQSYIMDRITQDLLG